MAAKRNTPDDQSDDELEIVSEKIVRRPRPSDEIVLVSHTRKKPRVQKRIVPPTTTAPVLATTVAAAPDDGDDYDDSPDEVAGMSDYDDMNIGDEEDDEEEDVELHGNAEDTFARLPSVPFTCGVCLSWKEACEGVILGASSAVCTCVVCRPCSTRSLRAHIASKRWPLACPDCGGERDGWECVKDLQWQDSAAGDALSKLVLGNETGDIKYCANPQCKTPFEFDKGHDDGTPNSAKIDCPLCKTSTCVRCNRVWHSGGCVKA